MGWGNAYMPERVFRNTGSEGSAALGAGSVVADIMNAILSTGRQDKIEAARAAMQNRQMNLQEQQAADSRGYHKQMLGYRGRELDNQTENYQRQAKIAAAKAAIAEGEQNASPVTGMLKEMGPDLREPEVIPEAARWNAAAGNAREGRTTYAPRAGMSDLSMQPMALEAPQFGVPQQTSVSTREGAMRNPGAQTALAVAFGGPVGAPRGISPGALPQPAPVGIAKPDQPVSPEEFVQERGPAMSNAVAMARARQAADAQAKAKAGGGNFHLAEKKVLEDWKAGNRAEQLKATVGVKPATDTAGYPQSMLDPAEQAVKDAQGKLAEIYTRSRGPQQQQLPLTSDGKTRAQIVEEGVKAGKNNAQIKDDLAKAGLK